MPPSDARYPRRGRAIAGLEPLEARELLAYSPLGFSLPDLSVQAYSAPVASWGQQIAVTATVYNEGSSTITEPFNQIPAGQPNPYANFTGTAAGAPGTSHADSPATTVDVYGSARPGKGPFYQLGVLAVPAIPQNSATVVSGDITLSSRPAGLPQYGKIFLTYVVNQNAAVLENNYTNNADLSHQPVTMAPALPNLQVVAFNVPTPLLPGQTITPVIQIANYGTAATSDQGPVTVEVVASESTNFGPGDVVLATYTVNNIPPLSAVTTTIPGSEAYNVQTPSNIVTLDSQTITLPSTPSVYFLGLKVDPLHTLKQQGVHSSSAMFDAFAKVGPPIPGVIPTTIIATTSGTAGGSYVFPAPVPGPATTSTTTTATSTVSFAAATAPAFAALKKKR